MLSASSYLVELSLDDLVDEARIAANGVVAELETTQSTSRLDLDRHRRSLAARHPDASFALRWESGRRSLIGLSGPWRHGAAPDGGPTWTQSGRFSGLTVVDVDGAPRLVARAYLSVNVWGEPAGVTVDLPVGEHLLEQTGVELREITFDSEDDAPAPADDSVAPRILTDGLTWFSFLGYTNWTTGEPGLLYQEIRVAPAVLYDRMFGAQSRIGEFSLGYAFLFALAIVGVLFLVIEFTVLIMGLALARSITGSVHQLFVGTEHVRGGDFEHRIIVRARDQLGELAESFNAMTASVRELLQQSAEKKRLEEELRIAREIQMFLLPRDTISIPGVTVTATCVPAREVGGDCRVGGGAHRRARLRPPLKRYVRFSRIPLSQGCPGAERWKVLTSGPSTLLWD